MKAATYPVTAALFLIGPPTSAGNPELGIEIGGTYFDSDDVDDDAGLGFGARLGYHINKTFQLEAHYRVASGAEVDLTTLLLNAVFNLHPKTRKTIVPYFLLGAGTANLQGDALVLEPDFTLGFERIDDDGTAYQAGVGSRFFLGKRAAVRIEAGGLVEDTFAESSLHLNTFAGLTWMLGRPGSP